MRGKIPLQILLISTRNRAAVRFQAALKDLNGISSNCGVTRLSITPYSSNPNSSGLFKNMLNGLKWFDYSKAALRAGGVKLYENVADRVRHEEFFEALGLPDTLFSWFLVIELHVWMVMARVMAEKDGRFVRNIIVETMWEDVRIRMKKLEEDSVSNISKTLQELSQQFGAAIIGYDEGLLGDDCCLAGALWRRMLQQKYGSATSLEALVGYVRQQIHQLDQLTAEEILVRPNLKWNRLMEIAP